MEDIRPTAKWANRMLRPLTSIHHRLQKHYEIRNSIADAKLKGKPDQPVPDRLRPLAKRAGTETGCNFSDEEPDDPAWIPGKPVNRRRIRHNYSSRGQRNGARRRSRLLIKSPEVQRTLPGAIEIATPLITGTAQGPSDVSSSIRKQLFRNILPPTSNAESSDRRRQSRTNNPNFPAYQGSWKEALDLSGDPGFVDIARSLDGVLIKFLKNTRAVASGINKHEQEGRGARSLLSMAARRLPEFIAEEQRLQDEADEDSEVDMCDAYFTELEAHYAPGGNGWQPLRDAVRAQGIHLVSEMILRGWVSKLAACRLLEECLDHGELDAFESLISRYLTTVRTYDYPPAFDPPRPASHCDDPIHVLRDYYSKTPGRRYFVFDEMAKLLSRRAFPPEWMVTKRWKKCVDGAIRSLSVDDGESAAATRAIEAILLSSAGIYPGTDWVIARVKGQDTSRSARSKDTRASVMNSTSVPNDQSPCPIPIQDALSNLSASLVTALCGMYIARSQASGANDKSTGTKARYVVEALSFGVQRAIALVLSCREMEGPSFQALRRGYVLLGEWMLQCSETSTPDVIGQSDSISTENIESFCLSLARQHDMVKQLAEFVQQVFHCCGHARRCDPARTPREIQTIVSRLAQIPTMSGVSLLLAKVAAETAMALAEVTLDEDDHTWALEMQGQAASSQQERSAEQSPAVAHVPPNDAINLYRWEESIGEWVASTPAHTKPLAARGVGGISSPTAGRAERPPVADSTSSMSYSLEPSEEVASSVTSSAPSMSGKRERANNDWRPPSPKRLRSSARTMAAAPVTSSASPAIRGRVAAARSKEPDSAPIAARTRTALRDLPQAKNCVLKQGPSTAQAGPIKLAPKIEVVIINHPIPVTPLLPVPSPSKTERVRRSTRTRPLPVQRVIPGSDDDSEDELSFL
ncbi:hypothetical protein ASPCADRAFT_138600 [Aspergillus carbonarius ITEM 5010]|uniref:Uncharacterized protein n=1 Tax=Aspergillus carbonarius (strain ITEM 5010) TaxID=602072 RepID=A0A1R3RZ65_ASPC5|nr:hypothetical protein ASPCADRAFT_138600 [Aspergillus carbonarius ITEM 5010]